MIEFTLAEATRTLFNRTHFGDGFFDRFREDGSPAGALGFQSVAFATDFDAVVVYLDHFDVEPALLAEGADGALDLFETWGEGADVHGRGRVEGGFGAGGRVAD